MDGTASDDAVAPLLHAIEQASVREDVLDGDALLQLAEGRRGMKQVVLDGDFPFPFPASCQGARERETTGDWRQLVTRR